MISGMLAIACLSYLLLVCGVKMWNVGHTGEKIPWWGSMLMWGLGLLALSGLMIVLDVNNTLASQDEFYQADLQEAIFFVQFGALAVTISTMLTFAEILFNIGFIASQGFGKPSERGEHH